MADYITREEFQNFRDDIIGGFKTLKDDRKSDFDELKVWMEEYLQQRLQPFSEDLHNRQEVREEKKEDKRVLRSSIIEKLTSSGIGAAIGAFLVWLGLNHK